MKANPISYIDTLIRYYLHIDPTELSDEQWATSFKQLENIRKDEQKALNFNM